MPKSKIDSTLLYGSAAALLAGGYFVSQSKDAVNSVVRETLNAPFDLSVRLADRMDTVFFGTKEEQMEKTELLELGLAFPESAPGIAMRLHNARTGWTYDNLWAQFMEREDNDEFKLNTVRSYTKMYGSQPKRPPVTDWLVAALIAPTLFLGQSAVRQDNMLL